MKLQLILRQVPQYREVLRALAAHKTPLVCTGLAHIHKAHFAAAISEDTKKPLLLIAPDEPTAVRFCEDIRGFCPAREVLHYPAREWFLRDSAAASREYEHMRLGVLGQVHTGAPIVVASAEAAMQYTLSPEALAGASLHLRGSFAGGLDTLVKALVHAGYARVEQVESTCTFAVRGGIVDLWSPSAQAPTRVEFWGDEIDSMAWFSPEDQRRGEVCDEVMVTPAGEAVEPEGGWLAFLERQKNVQRKKTRAAEEIARLCDEFDTSMPFTDGDRFMPVLYGRGYTLLDHLGDEAVMLLSDAAALREALQNANSLLLEDVKEMLADGLCPAGCERYMGDFDDLMCAAADRDSILLDTFARSLPDFPTRGLIDVPATALAPWGGELSSLIEDVRPYITMGESVVVLLPTERGCRALVRDLIDAGIPASYAADPAPTPGKVVTTDATISAGFEYPQAKIAVISHAHAAAPRRVKKRRAQDAIRSLSDLREGDYVVHATHGIGIFSGIVKKTVQGVQKDYIKIRYYGSDVLFVPVTQLDLISKYIGKSEDSTVRLSRLGSPEWQKTRARVRAAVADMAEELTELYRRRLNAKGFAFSEDNDWQRDFELRFPYTETDDQLRCIAEIKADMQSERPMDRLLCGDVGFGKTEVALRAAFKCVMDGKQCAVLVPTTILAWQHYQTFTQRMEGFPIKVELLSRFKTPKEQADIVRRLATGEVDIVIGTHRLIQKDVKYKDLGLCIIDEEQRFGVAHKERFKSLRESVDVLTLSATPIPRTLSMAMSGIRDMSLIEEAPQDRHPVQTYVVEHDWGIIAQALSRELHRGGQAFYLHNRVEDIDGCALKLQGLLPDARIAVAHGKMTEDQLSVIWQRLIDREIDILVCTTIIETGVDVPNCNTLILEDADRMGLSQLYQLRGRVGRSTRRAFAYFTFRPMKALSEVAQKRLAAIREFTSFGSGFHIAMRDMEIRGAGSVLGAQQHGHMEAVGYEMYLRLLGEAVSEARGEPVEKIADCQVDIQIDAHIPEEYIPSLSQRLDIYKRIAAVETEEQAADVTDELIDRFGEPPRTVGGLLDIALLRNRAARMGIREIRQQEKQILFYFEHADPAQIAGMASRLNGRMLFHAGDKPYAAVTVPPKASPIDVITEALDAANE